MSCQPPSLPGGSSAPLPLSTPWQGRLSKFTGPLVRPSARRVRVWND